VKQKPLLKFNELWGRLFVKLFIEVIFYSGKKIQGDEK
jgi:hypothetical protein